ncbi:coiled-coil domain containing 162 [Rhinoraja longicauda]
MGERYTFSESPKVQMLEKQLATGLAELKQEIEENGILQGSPTRPFSSVGIPKDISHFRKERELHLKRALQVAEAKPLLIQADVMQRELESCLKPEYTTDSLPLLLHQFFTDRIHQLAQCKYLHMLRWKRFCQHTKVIEQLYPLYKEQMSRVMKEHDDAVQRAGRLARARECHLMDAGPPSKCVTQEDIIIYLQWLVCHLHSVTTIHNYLRVLQYMPMCLLLEGTVGKLPDVLAEDDGRTSGVALPPTARVSTRPGTALSSASGSAGKPSARLSSSGTHAVSALNKDFTLVGCEGAFESEVNLSLPVHKLKMEEFRHQLRYLVGHFNIEYDVDDIRTTANEMELFTLVMRKFRSIFSEEESMKTFPAYDTLEPGAEWGHMKGPNMALKKEANWIPFLKIKPKQDPWQQKIMTRLKQHQYVDEILRMQAHFLQVPDPDRVMEALRQHAAAVHEPMSAASRRAGQHPSHIWNRIYGNAKLYQEPRRQKSGLPADWSDRTGDGISLNKRPKTSTMKDQDEGYDLATIMQRLGLDEGAEESGNDPALTRGAYLSLLFLRHLRIRELQRVCLGTLNYLRSIERTLTIDTCGLTLRRGRLAGTAADTRHIAAARGGSGATDGIGSHGYVHNTPADYKRELTQFMEFSEVENHDDFYVNEGSYIHTRDQQGAYVMYDVALKDFNELEAQLLLLATEYIGRGGRMCGRRPSTGSLPPPCGDADLRGWAQLSVDRFGVLLDLWRWETAFQEHKRQLVDGYYEAYQHVCDVEERVALAQVITDIMYQRPRFNLNADYFARTYQAECTCLKLHLQLIADILNRQIEEQREYVQRIWRDGALMESGVEFGLPLNIIARQPVAINNSCPALRKVYLLEFHASLGLAARVRQALEHAYGELCHAHRPRTADDSIDLETQLLRLATAKWASMGTPDSPYSLQVQQDLFAGVYIEDPLLVRDVGLSFIEAAAEGEGRAGEERPAFALNAFSRLLEIVTLRHRLLEATAHTAILAQLYKSVATKLGFDEFHLYLRPVQFEFASHKDKADQPPPAFITTLEDDSSVDRYAPSSLPLAIQEVDENHIGKFSFRTKEAVLQLMARRGLDNLQVALACQTVQKNALMVAVQQALLCSVDKAAISMETKDGGLGYRGPEHPSGTRGGSTARESESQQPHATLGTEPLLANQRQRSTARKRHREAFVSIQLEKVAPRDLMLNLFLQKKNAAGSIMKNPVEMEKIKRELICDYCHRVSERMSQCSLRGQIIAYYNSLLGLLQDFPTICQTYFVLGQPQEKKGDRDSELGLISNPRKLLQRPRNLLSPDGETFLNLWYIPHHSEVLVMFKTLEEKVCRSALTRALEIAAALHDIVSYLCCFAQLGGSPTGGSRKMQPLAADWGGLEGIGWELQEIQGQVDKLQNPRDPAAIATLLSLRRDVMFLQFDAAVRHLIREVFLSTGSVAGFQAVTDGMYGALPPMSSSVISSLYSSSLPLPEPLDAWSHKALMLFPWRSFLAREGLVPGMISNLQSIEYSVQMCLSGLNDRDRIVANAELLGLSLLMEDALQSGTDASPFPGKDGAEADAREAKTDEDSAIEEETDGVQSPTNNIATTSKAAEPIGMYKALKSFLIVWKQLEVLKEEWGRLKLGVEEINSAALYKQFCKLYRVEILYPALMPLVCRAGMEAETERMMMDNRPLLPPEGTSEMETKSRQLHKLLESMECYMIRELQKKIARELTLVVSERARGEATLPTDDWKHSVMTENFPIARPQIVETFVQRLKEHSCESENEITFGKDHLSDCLLRLACDVMGRERSNFETYSMCYENILRREHQLLYQKEQELKGLQQSQASSAGAESQLADFNHQIIIEITALHTKLANLQEENSRLKAEVRREVRQEFDALVRNMFASSFALKQKLDEYHVSMNRVACKLISEVRRNAVDSIIALKRKVGSTKSDDALKENLERQDQLQSLREENSQLQGLVCKLRTLTCWRLTTRQGQFHRSSTALEQEVIRTKKDYLNVKMLAEEEKVGLQQQLVTLRTALARSQSENDRIKNELDKEKQLLREYRHRAAEEWKSQQQLERVRTSSVEQCLQEVQLNEHTLHTLNAQLEATCKHAQTQYNKISKEVKQLRCQLSHERSLKLDAFQRVDELQTQLHDFEAALSLSNNAETTPGALKKSASLQSSASSFRSTLPGTGRQTHFRTQSLTFARDHFQRCLTTDPQTTDASGTVGSGGKRIQRPKTVPTRLHNKVMEALLPDTEDARHHSLILELKDYRLNQK